MADEAVDGGEADDDGSCDVAGHGFAGGKVLDGGERVAGEVGFDGGQEDVERGGVVVEDGLQEAGEGGERDEAGDHAGAVDSEALEPLDEVVAVGAEDEELVTEVGDGDVDGSGEDGCSDDGEIDEALGEGTVKQREGDDEAGVAEDGIEDSNEKIANELAGRYVREQAREPVNHRSVGLAGNSACGFANYDMAGQVG